jgi:hypothetical protein
VVQDQLLARNVYALLGAITYAGCGVGTNVTYPIGRNPIGFSRGGKRRYPGRRAGTG